MKASDLKGLAVLTTVDPQKVGTIDHLIIDPGNRRVAGIQVKSSRYTTPEFVRVGDIKNIGKDALTIDSTSALGSLSQFPDLVNLPGLEALSKVNVVTESGVKLGTIGDVEIDPHTLTVTRYLLHGNILEKLRHSQRSIEATPELRYGKGFLMVPDRYGPQAGREARVPEQPTTGPENPPHDQTESSGDEPRYR